MDKLVVGFMLIFVWPAIIGIMSYDAGIKSNWTCPKGWQTAYRDETGKLLYCTAGKGNYATVQREMK